ncbi:MAG: redoxin domain-containing protein [Bacteroidetes bacterium]|nr:redoxin domain-containing protein [Bacteroidota bacterium]
MKNILLVISIAILSVCNGCNTSKNEILGSKEFSEIIKQKEIQLIDIRTPEEFSTGYIEGASNIDFYDPAFFEKMTKLDKKRPLAIYCKSEGRTKEALKMLADAGFEKIYMLKGGLLSWEHDGYKLVTPKPVEPSTKSISKAEYDKLINSAKIVIVDFNATWCKPCLMLKPILDKISTNYANKNVKILAVDVDESKALSNELEVNEIPLLLFYKDGKLMEQMIGFNPEETIVQAIEKYLK